MIQIQVNLEKNFASYHAYRTSVLFNWDTVHAINYLSRRFPIAIADSGSVK